MANNRAPILCDGVPVGYLSISFSEELPIGEGLPPSVGLAGSGFGSIPYSPGAARGYGGNRLGGTHKGTGGTQHVAPHRRLTPHPRTGEAPRHLDPANRERTAESSK